jgi:hypothetical protein
MKPIFDDQKLVFFVLMRRLSLRRRDVIKYDRFGATTQKPQWHMLAKAARLAHDAD